MQVKDMTSEELRLLIRETVIDSLEELMPVQRKFLQNLTEVQDKRHHGHQGSSLDRVKKQLGLGE